MTSQHTAVSRYEWPQKPYKGIEHFDREDVLLLAGREDDVYACSDLLGIGSKRIMLLHGPTGCGKSSFLRAGLIPYLEGQIDRFRFVRDQLDTPVFVRSTNAPLQALADAFRGQRNHDEFTRDDVHELADQLVRYMSEEASKSKTTIIFVIDQAEELFTFSSTDTEEEARAYFRFLATLSRARVDLKLILTLRTEYHGRFFGKLRQTSADLSRIESYYLGDLEQEQLEKAILRPTEETIKSDSGKSGSEIYKFGYEDGLAKTIAATVWNEAPGSMLPVLQIVCQRLYDQVLQKKNDSAARIITHGDYSNLGGIEGQMNAHLDSALQECLNERDQRRRSSFYKSSNAEAVRWRYVLWTLVRIQPDGTITTLVRPTPKLRDTADQHGLNISDFESTCRNLASKAHRILRDATIHDRGQAVSGYSLGHDILAVVLYHWNRDRQRDGLTISVYRLALLVLSTSLAIVSQTRAKPVLIFISLILAPGFLLIALLPDREPMAALCNLFYEPFHRISSTMALDRSVAEPLQEDSTRRLNSLLRRAAAQWQKWRPIGQIFLTHVIWALLAGSLIAITILLCVSFGKQ